MKDGKTKIPAVLLLAVFFLTACTGPSASSMPDASSGNSSGRLPGDKPGFNEVSSTASPADPAAVDIAMPSCDTPYETAKGRQSYLHLPDELTKRAYAEMLTASAYITSGRTKNGEYRVRPVFLNGIWLSENQLRLALEALRNDQPQIFWIVNRFGYSVSAEGTSIELYSHYSAEECAVRIDRVEEEARRLTGVLQEGMTPFERELALHDALLQTVEYDGQAKDSSEKPEPFTVYGALVEGKAVCQGYALAMQLLLYYAGIESTIVSGSASGIAHAWNAVQLEGSWYYLDPTWDDTDDGIRYHYYNVTTEVLTQDHGLYPSYPGKTADGEEQFNVWIPVCTATAENYFTKRAVLLDGFDEPNDGRLLAELVRMRAAGETVLSVRFASEMDFDESLSMLLSQEPHKLVYLLRKANGRAMQAPRLSTKDIVYSEVRSQNAVMIRLKQEKDESKKKD